MPLIVGQSRSETAVNGDGKGPRSSCPLDGGENGGERALSADAVANACLSSCIWLRADDGPILCAEDED